MSDPLEDVLRLVADGRLSADEAAPIIEALAAARGEPSPGGTAASASRDARWTAAAAARFGVDAGRARPDVAPPSGPPSRLRVQVRDGGRAVVDLQLPGVLAELAGAIPGIPAAYADRVREALRSGIRGPIVDLSDDDGSGVTITIE
jgi:hypothetical protein